MSLSSSTGRPKRVVLLGASGSIGDSALKVIAAHPERLELVGVAARASHERLAAIARSFPSVRHVGIVDEAALTEARAARNFGPSVTLHGGLEGLKILAALPEADIVLVAVVGTTGLAPALAALAAGKDLALATKEILVLAGKFVLAAAQASGARLLPVDSEHNAVFQCLEGREHSTISKVILTASGGAFRDWPLAKLAEVTPADALKHPNWSMGPKITVDSATLANKGLELIEAQCLFGLRPGQCTAVLHPQSIVHCLVEFTDGTMLSQLTPPSMTFPIQHALLYPQRAPAVSPPVDLSQPVSLDFRPLDPARFPFLRLARETMEAGGTAPAVFNAANEVAVAAFLDGRLPFLQIATVVDQVLERLPALDPDDLQTVLAVDADARRQAADAVRSLS